MYTYIHIAISVSISNYLSIYLSIYFSVCAHHKCTLTLVYMMCICM